MQTAVFEVSRESEQWNAITRKLVNQSHSKLQTPCLQYPNPIPRFPFPFQDTSWTYKRQVPVSVAWRGWSLSITADTTAQPCTSVSLLSRRRLWVSQMETACAIKLLETSSLYRIFLFHSMSVFSRKVRVCSTELPVLHGGAGVASL